MQTKTPNEMLNECLNTPAQPFGEMVVEFAKFYAVGVTIFLMGLAVMTFIR